MQDVKKRSPKYIDPLKLAELNELRTRFQMLEADKKAFGEMTAWRIKQNEESIQYARQENRQLRKRLGDTIKESIVQSEQTLHSRNYEVDHRSQIVYELRTQIDRTKSEIIEKECDVKILQEDLIEIDVKKRERSYELEDFGHKIQNLQMRIAKAQSKAIEAQNIGRKFEAILNKLKWERVSYNQRIATMEAASKAMQQDFEALNAMSRDAQHAKEQARNEYSRVLATLDRERRTRDSVLMEKRSFARTRVEIMQRLSTRGDPTTTGDTFVTEVGGIQSSSTSPSPTQDEFSIEFRRIKEQIGLTDANQLVEKVVSQNDTVESLENMKIEATEKRQQLLLERNRLRSKFEELKCTTVEGLGNRRYLEFTDDKISNAIVRCNLARERYEHTSKMLIEVKHGIENICDICGIVVNPNGSDENLGELVNLVEGKITAKLADIENEDKRFGDQPLDAFITSLQKKMIKTKSEQQSPNVRGRSIGMARVAGIGGDEYEDFENHSDDEEPEFVAPISKRTSAKLRAAVDDGDYNRPKPPSNPQRS